MTDSTPTAEHPLAIDTSFTGTVVSEKNSGWACVVMPDSGEFFGTRRAVKVTGTVDGHEFAATRMPMGDGTHMVPLKAALRKLLGKGLGDEVSVTLSQRTS